MIRLVSVYEADNAPLYLYALLVERPVEANISHRKMPTAAEHLAFFASRPYLVWHLVQEGKTVLGSVYLTKQREIGVFIFREHQNQGWAKKAIAELRKLHPGRCLANVAPGNEVSKRLFEGLGARHIQNTYEL